MSKFTGNIIRLPAVTPTQNSASGVYTLDDQFTAQSSGTWPIVRDQYFNYTTLLLTGAVQGTAYPNPVTQPYSFLSDASTNNFVVSPNGDVSARPFNPYLNSYSNRFDGGTSTRLTLASSSDFAFGTGAYTIEAWVYIAAFSSSGNIVFDAGNASGSIALSMSNTGGVLINKGGTGAVLSTSSSLVSLNAWNHIAASRVSTSSNETRIFVNGVLSAIGTDNNNWTVTTDPSIGGLNVANYTINGYISNLSVLKGTAKYTSSFTPSTNPLPTNTTNQVLLACQANRFIDSNTATTAKTITVNGSPAVSQNSPFVSYDTTNGSGYFDGTNDNLMVADATALDLGLGNFTIECWIYLAGGSGTFRQFFSKYTGGVGIEWYVSNANKLEVYFNGGAGQITSTGTINTNTWYHVALVRSGTGAAQTKFYINGSEDGSNQVNLNLDNAGALYIGESGAASNDYLGYICDMRVIKGTAVYTGNFTPPIAPIRTSGAASAASYPSTTNVNTSFAESATSLLTLQTRAPATNNGFIDSSPNNFVVTRNGNTTQGSFSPFSPTGWSNYFNGSASLQTASSSSLTFGTGDFSISFWIYPTVSTAGANTGVMGIGASVNGTFLIYTKFPGYPDNTIFVAVYGGGSFGSSIPLNVNQWNHVAISRASGTLSIYINGNRGANSSLADNLNGSIASIGKPYYNLSVENYTGYLADIRFVKGTALYSGTSITVPTSPSTLVAGTALLTSQYNRFYDGSGITSSFTIAGSPSVQAFSPFAPAQSYIPSQIGGSGYFDGNGDYLSAASNALALGTNNFTIEFWAYVSSYASANACLFIINYNNTAAPFKAMYLANTSSGSSFLVGDNSSSWVVNISLTNPPLNQWNHWAVTRSGSSWAVFINGVRSGTATSSASVTTASSGVQVMTDPRYVDTVATGYMSGFRIVNGTAIYDPAQTSITIPTAPPTAVTNTNMLLNFTNGGIVDATGKNNLETVANSGVQTSQAKWSPGSMYFDGTGDYLSFPDSPTIRLGSSDFVFECWARFDDFSSNRTICFLNGNNNTLAALRLYVGTDAKVALLMSKAPPAWDVNSGAIGSALSTNTWYYIAVQRSSAGVKVFLDGTQIGSTYSLTGSLMTGTFNYIGDITATTQPMKGYMDDVRLTLYARPITASPTGPFPLG